MQPIDRLSSRVPASMPAALAVLALVTGCGESDDDGDGNTAMATPGASGSNGSSGAGSAGAPGAAGNPTTGTGGQSSEGSSGGATGNPTAPGGFCLQVGSGDYSENGPYQVATEDVTIGSSGAYTIWYPETFDANCKHPIVAWGNGTTVTGSAVYSFFNDRAASWGMVAIGSHNSNVGSGDFHRAAIDYLLEQNDTPNSKFYQKLSPRVGVSGHSQGGAGASRAATHPNVEALVPVGFSGTARPGQAFLCLTGTADIASIPGACRSAVERAPGPAMVAIWEGGDHVVTETLAGWIAGDPGTRQMTRLYGAWFRCFLADDPVACGLFTGGSSCDICDDPGWAEVTTNNL